MPNLTSGFWSKFGSRPATSINSANANLERNVRVYVNSYLKNRNVPNKIPPINNYMARALHKYINTKRARVAGAAAAAAGNAGAPAPVQAAVAANVANTVPSASPLMIGNKAANAAQQAGATPLQITAAAAGAAKQQALSLGMGSNKANNAGAQAAAQAANAARPNATPAQTANTAANAANAAGLPEAAQKQAAASAAQQGETGSPAPLSMNINVPGMNKKVKVVRNNVGSNWRFANSANNSKYNLNGRNLNVPTIRNISTVNMFKQAQAQRPAPKVNNRNVNAIRAKLNGPNMSPGNWYRYAASLGYNTGKYANEANRLMTAGNKKALSTFILKSMMAVHPNKGNRTNAKNQQIRNLLTRNLTKARSNLSEN
jgi:hypothetical protein